MDLPILILGTGEKLWQWTTEARQLVTSRQEMGQLVVLREQQFFERHSFYEALVSR
jgi:hypothetical protein